MTVQWLVKSQVNPEEMENHLQRAEVQAAINGIESTATRISSTLGMKYLYTAVPVWVKWENHSCGAVVHPIN